MSNVVKRDMAESYNSAVVMDLGDIEAHAASIIRDAQSKAAEIVSGAEKSAVEIRERAEKEGRTAGLGEGRDEGLKAGREQGRKEAFAQESDEIMKATKCLGDSCAEFDARKESLFKQAESDLLKLSMMIARKVVAKEISADAHITADNVKRCLELLSRRKDLVVRVAPAALSVVKESLPEQSKALGDLSSVKVVGDETIGPGGCLVTGESGMLDATIESQFAEVERILFGESNV